MKTVLFSIAFFTVINFSFADIVLESTTTANTTNSSALSISHNLESGNLLIISVSIKDQLINSVTWNLTELNIGAEIIQNNLRVAMYYLTAPETGNYELNITTSGNTDISAVISVFSGIDITNPFRGFTATGSQSITAQIEVESSAGETVVDAMGCKNQNPNIDEGQTLINSTGTSLKNFSSKKIGNPFTLMEWQMDVINDWGIVAASLVPETELPVELLYLNLMVTGNSVEVSWATSSETNNDYFTVYRSSDGNKFSAIGIINGAGTSNILNKYNFTDFQPLKGISYYRISQTDFDLSTEFSGIAAISLNNTELNYNLYPALITEGGTITAEITGSEPDVSINFSVIDMSGKIYFTNDVSTDNSGSLLFRNDNLSLLPSGIYFMNVNTGSENLNRRFIIAAN